MREVDGEEGEREKGLGGVRGGGGGGRKKKGFKLTWPPKCTVLFLPLGSGTNRVTFYKGTNG